MRIILPNVGKIESGKLQIQWCLNNKEAEYVKCCEKNKQTAKVLVIIVSSSGKEKRYIFSALAEMEEIAFFSKGENKVLATLLMTVKKSEQLFDKLLEATSEFNYYRSVVKDGVINFDYLRGDCYGHFDCHANGWDEAKEFLQSAENIVEVPAEVFSPPPPDWVKKVIKFDPFGRTLQRNLDSCNVWRDAALSCTWKMILAVLVMVWAIVTRGLTAVGKTIIGYRFVNWSSLVHPFNLDYEDVDQLKVLDSSRFLDIANTKGKNWFYYKSTFGGSVEHVAKWRWFIGPLLLLIFSGLFSLIGVMFYSPEELLLGIEPLDMVSITLWVMTLQFSIAMLVFLSELFIYNTSSKCKLRVMRVFLAVLYIGGLYILWVLRPELSEVSGPSTTGVFVSLVMILFMFLVFRYRDKLITRVTDLAERISVQSNEKLGELWEKIEESSNERMYANLKKQEVELANKIQFLSCEHEDRDYVPIEDLPIKPVQKIWLHVTDLHNRFVCKPTSVD